MNKIIQLCVALCLLSVSARAEGPLVVATTGMVADLARQLGGEFVTVEALMGPGVDPHLYKATHGDLKKLSNARLIVYSGLHLEGKMVEVLESLGKSKPTFALTRDIPQESLRSPPEFAGAHDPHVWFDVALWSHTIPVMVEALSTILPEHHQEFVDRGEAYKSEMLALDGWVRKQVAMIPKAHRVLVTAHDAFGYFGRAYDIDVVGLQGISTATEYGIADIRRVVSMVVERNVKAIFVESSVPRQFVDAIIDGAKDQGRSVVVGGELYSDSMGAAGTKEGNYRGMVEHNVSTVVKALQ